MSNSGAGKGQFTPDETGRGESLKPPGDEDYVLDHLQSASNKPNASDAVSQAAGKFNDIKDGRHKRDVDSNGAANGDGESVVKKSSSDIESNRIEKSVKKKMGGQERPLRKKVARSSSSSRSRSASKERQKGRRAGGRSRSRERRRSRSRSYDHRDERSGERARYYASGNRGGSERGRYNSGFVPRSRGGFRRRGDNRYYPSQRRRSGSPHYQQRGGREHRGEYRGRGRGGYRGRDHSPSSRGGHFRGRSSGHHVSSHYHGSSVGRRQSRSRSPMSSHQLARRRSASPGAANTRRRHGSSPMQDRNSRPAHGWSEDHRDSRDRSPFSPRYSEQQGARQSRGNKSDSHRGERGSLGSLKDVKRRDEALSPQYGDHATKAAGQSHRGREDSHKQNAGADAKSRSRKSDWKPEKSRSAHTRPEDGETPLAVLAESDRWRRQTSDARSGRKSSLTEDADNSRGERQGSTSDLKMKGGRSKSGLGAEVHQEHQPMTHVLSLEDGGMITLHSSKQKTKSSLLSRIDALKNQHQKTQELMKKEEAEPVPAKLLEKRKKSKKSDKKSSSSPAAATNKDDLSTGKRSGGGGGDEPNDADASSVSKLSKKSKKKSRRGGSPQSPPASESADSRRRSSRSPGTANMERSYMRSRDDDFRRYHQEDNVRPDHRMDRYPEVHLGTDFGNARNLHRSPQVHLPSFSGMDRVDAPIIDRSRPLAPLGATPMFGVGGFMGLSGDIRSFDPPVFRGADGGLPDERELKKIQIDIRRNLQSLKGCEKPPSETLRGLGDPAALFIPRRKDEGLIPIFEFLDRLPRPKDEKAPSQQISLIAKPLDKYEKKLQQELQQPEQVFGDAIAPFAMMQADKPSLPLPSRWEEPAVSDRDFKRDHSRERLSDERDGKKKRRKRTADDPKSPPRGMSPGALNSDQSIHVKVNLDAFPSSFSELSKEKRPDRRHDSRKSRKHKSNDNEGNDVRGQRRDKEVMLEMTAGHEESLLDKKSQRPHEPGVRDHMGDGGFDAPERYRSRSPFRNEVDDFQDGGKSFDQRDIDLRSGEQGDRFSYERETSPRGGLWNPELDDFYRRGDPQDQYRSGHDADVGGRNRSFSREGDLSLGRPMDMGDGRASLERRPRGAMSMDRGSRSRSTSPQGDGDYGRANVKHRLGDRDNDRSVSPSARPPVYERLGSSGRRGVKDRLGDNRENYVRSGAKYRDHHDHRDRVADRRGRGGYHYNQRSFRGRWRGHRGGGGGGGYHNSNHRDSYHGNHRGHYSSNHKDDTVKSGSSGDWQHDLYNPDEDRQLPSNNI